MIEACLEMHNITAKNHRSSFRKPYEQRLVTWRVSRGGKQHQASVAKDVVVAVDKLYRVLLVEGNSVLSAPGPLVLDSLHQHHRVGEHFNVPRVIRVAMGHGHQLYVPRLDMYLFELSRKRYRFAPDWPGTWTPLVKHLFMIRKV